MSQIAAGLLRPGRVAEVAAWAIVAGMAVLVVTQLAGIDGRRSIAAAQAVTPYVLTVALPVAAIALVTRHWVLGAASLLVALPIGVMSWPLLHPPGEPAAAAGATPVSVFHANLLYENTDTGPIVSAVARTGADLLAFTEYTPAHSAGLLASSLVDQYPYRIEVPGRRAQGSALWSRYPIELLPSPPMRNDPIYVEVAAPQPFRLYVVHTTSPIVDADDLADELAVLANDDSLEASGPTLMVGDFNASYWHPVFRELLDSGWRDAHTALGRGMSSSWPDDRRVVPPFVRIDHALLNDGLTAQAIDDVRIPGSDHIGFTVTVAASTRT